MLIPIKHESIKWFCQDLLPAIDTPSLFTTAFSELLRERHWQQNVLNVSNNLDTKLDSSKEEIDIESEAWLNEGVVAQRNPGILITTFLGTWIYHLSNCDEKLRDLSFLLGSILERISLCNSSQAVKWIVRCFSLPVVQACLLNRNTQKGIYKISLRGLQHVRILVKVRVRLEIFLFYHI